MINALITFLKGFWVGGTMTVPGVSGGTQAIIMGVYDRLISSVSSFFKKPKENFLFLLEFALGGGVGIILLAKLMTWLLEMETAGFIVRYFFFGAVAGGIPLIFSEAKIKKINSRVIIFLLLGVLFIFLLSLLPDGVFSASAAQGVSGMLLQFVGGFIIAVALVLPGISASQMLYMLGIYDEIMKNISEFNIIPLIPLGVGLVVGTILTAKVIELLIARYPMEIYMIILGFILGSLPELFPGIPSGLMIIACLAAVVIGFFFIYFISKSAIKAENGEEKE